MLVGLLDMEDPYLADYQADYDGILLAVHGFSTGIEDPQFPVIHLGDASETGPSKGLDLADELVGRKAAEMLLDVGVVSFGYFDGLHDSSPLMVASSRSRFEGFKRGVQETISPLIPAFIERHEQAGFSRLGKWLYALPKPAGIFAFNDFGALALAEACRVNGFKVPEDIALVGVDNDQLVCGIHRPFLSSVDPRADLLAYEGMRRLMNWIQGLEYEPASEPEPVACARESTGVDSSPNREVVKAVHWIRELPVDVLTPEAVAKKMDRSLRRLEVIFREQLRYTIQHAIIQERNRRVKQLLRDTDLSVERIAERMGREVASMRKSFVRYVGKSPREYRNSFRGQVGAGRPSAKGAPQSKLISIYMLNHLYSLAARDFLRGAEQYVRQHENVTLVLNAHARSVGPGLSIDFDDGLPYEAYDGMVCMPEVAIPAELVGSMPIAGFEHRRDLSRFFTIEVDHLEVGVLAAEHFLMKGYRNFGFCGMDWSQYWQGAVGGESRESARYKGFEQRLFSAKVDPQAVSRTKFYSETDLAEWLRGLPKPCAVMTYNDFLAVKLMGVCQQIGLDIPGEVALVGVDNDVLLGHLNSSPLSSVTISFQRMGYLAIEKLVDTIEQAGEALPQDQAVLPQCVIERASSAGVASQDFVVVTAAAYIQANFSDPISVEQIAAAAGVSRRGLETRFKAELGASPRFYLEQVRLSAAKELITQTDSTVDEISSQTGYQRGSYFSQVFTQRVGMQPIEFREARSWIAH